MRLCPEPQGAYDGFLLVMIGFLLQWPTIPALIMFPILVWVYTRLARNEEREVAAGFGDEWTECAARTPVFVPHLSQAPRRGRAMGSGPRRRAA
ncbi:methyltransferase family protein [Nocardia australiensis]|uniref:methyltransferase family protein n=1 Tax=Nocardia australiensis TaxID=2887191 RepID=UPI001D132C31|nr:hypothetical protein [Nocardia australiensis]